MFTDIRPELFRELAGGRNLHLNVAIPRSTSRATYEFFVSTAGFAPLYATSLFVRPA